MARTPVDKALCGAMSAEQGGCIAGAFTPMPAGRLGRLLGWHARGDGTDYVLDCRQVHHGFGVRWHTVHRPGQLLLIPGFDWLTCAGVLAFLAALLAGAWLVAGASVIFMTLISAFTALLALLFVLTLIVSPRHLGKDGPPLHIDDLRGVIHMPGQSDLSPADIQAVECVAFVLAMPNGKHTHTYTWGTHLVLRLAGTTPRYRVIALVGSNLRRSGRRMAAHLSAPYRWTHLGILRTEELPMHI
ncbi:MAG: hypothetical protein WD042_13980 [Phycisphaeraceae bacterium]